MLASWLDCETDPNRYSAYLLLQYTSFACSSTGVVSSQILFLLADIQIDSK